MKMLSSMASLLCHFPCYNPAPHSFSKLLSPLSRLKYATPNPLSSSSFARATSHVAKLSSSSSSVAVPSKDLGYHQTGFPDPQISMEWLSIRSGHHCAQISHRELGVSSRARASLHFYNTKEEIDAFTFTISFFKYFS